MAMQAKPWLVTVTDGRGAERTVGKVGGVLVLGDLADRDAGAPSIEKLQLKGCAPGD